MSETEPIESPDSRLAFEPPPATDDDLADLSTKLLSWEEQKTELERYFTTLGNAIGVFAGVPGGREGIELAAAVVAAGSEATVAIAAQKAAGEDALGEREPTESARSVGLWASARVCHDSITQIAALAGQNDPAIAWVASVFSMMLARAGQGLVKQAKQASADAVAAAE